MKFLLRVVRVAKLLPLFFAGLFLASGISVFATTIGTNVNVTGTFGISSSTPSTTFGAVGSGYFTGGLGVGTLNTTAGTLQTSGNGTVGGALTVNGAGASSFVGNLGVGSTTPSTTVGVVGSGYLTGGIGAGTVETGAGNLTGTGRLSIASTAATSTFSTGGLTVGTSQLVVQQNSGSIGVGTTTPNWLLQVNGTRPSLALSDSSQTLGANLRHWLISSMGGILYVGTSTDSYATSTPPALTILNAGNVGIGTSSPSSLFSIQGTGPIINTFDTSASGRSFFLRNGGVAAGKFDLFDNTAGVSRLTVDSAGNVGVGSTSPAQLFSVGGSGYITTGFGVGTTETGAGNITGTGRLSITTTSATSSFSTGGIAVGTTQFVILSANGNVGINTATPASKLDVNGGVAIGTYAGTNAAPSNGVIISGTVGIGTSSPSANFPLNLSTAATTTIDLDSTATNSGGCIQFKSATGNVYFRAYATTTGTLILESGTCK